jgi:hypothetical protein
MYLRYKRVGTRKSWVAGVVEVINEGNAEAPPMEQMPKVNEVCTEEKYHYGTLSRLRLPLTKPLYNKVLASIATATHRSTNSNMAS